MLPIKNKYIKKSITLLLLIAIMLPVFTYPTSAETGITPYYNNVTTINSRATVSDNGTITITNSYKSPDGKIAKATVTTYIEKQTLGLFWFRVDIGQPDKQWVDTVYQSKYTGSHSFQVTSKGTYRIKVNYKIEGTNGSIDNETKEITVQY